MADLISRVYAREIINARGIPTIETTVVLDSGITTKAASPAGLSVSDHEAVDLRDGDIKRYMGKGVQKAVSNVNDIISKALKGKNPCDQREIDELLISLDGTRNKSNLGGNAMISTSVAEQTIAALLCGARKLRECDALVRNGEFSKRNTIRGFELRGKKLGVIGFGRIGRSIASIAGKGFGMEIYYYDPYITTAADEEYCRIDSIRDILSIADVVTIHLPLTEDTYHFIGEKEFGYMKKDSFFINYARGALIDIDALIHAIRKHEIGGAALDVFEDETIEKRDVLCSLSEVVLSPHTAAFTEESLKNMALHAAITVDEVLSGKTPRWYVSGI